MKKSHAEQAATLLVSIDDLDQLLDGTWSIGGKLQLGQDEVRLVRGVREAMITLLGWHFENGAGALFPIAEDLGLVTGGRAL